MNVEIAQLAGRDGDKAYNLARALEAIDACARSTQLLVLPELHVSGFPTKRTVAALAEPIEGPTMHAICEAARRKSVAVAVGFVESEAGHFFNTTVLVTPEAGVAMRYRKTHLFGGERGVVEAGDRFVTTLWNGLRVGILVCYDIEFPEPARALAQLGAQLLIVTNGNMDPYGPIHRACIMARAVENQAYAVLANRVGTGFGVGLQDLVFAGGSCVVDPFGAMVLEAGREEATLRMQLDLGKLTACRRDFVYLDDQRVRVPGSVREEGDRRELLIG
jgi:(R)-amidase